MQKLSLPPSIIPPLFSYFTNTIFVIKSMISSFFLLSTQCQQVNPQQFDLWLW